MRKTSATLLASAFAVTATFGLALPASAAVPQPQAQASCSASATSCSVSTTVSSVREVVFATFFPGASGSTGYTVKNASGSTLCSGRIGWNNSGQCTFGAVTSGKITFQINKGAGFPAGTITVGTP